MEVLNPRSGLLEFKTWRTTKGKEIPQDGKTREKRSVVALKQHHEGHLDRGKKFGKKVEEPACNLLTPHPRT